MSKKEEAEDAERYIITLKGVISSVVDERTADKIVDNLELHMRRHYSKTGHPAIVFDLDEGVFKFVSLSKEEEAEAA